MTSYNSLNIQITQKPLLLSSIDIVNLESDIFYDNSDRQSSILDTTDGLVVYTWLYSADGGKTFKTLNENNSILSININTLNINYIYKLKVSIDRNSSTVLLNNKTNTNIISNSNNDIILTNQENDDSEVWYSEEIKINHDLDLEDTIIEIALNDIIDQLGNELNFGVVSDNKELNRDDVEQTIEDTQNTETIPIGSDSPTGAAGIITTTCYENRVSYTCGVAISYCFKEERIVWPGITYDCNDFSVCENSCVVDDHPLIIINEVVGQWKNTKIGNGQYRWCQGGVKTISPIPATLGTTIDNCGEPLSDPTRGSAMSCPDAGSATNYVDCPEQRNFKGGCPGEVYRYPKKKWCNPPVCPGTTTVRNKPFQGITGSIKQHKCDANKWMLPGGCECSDKGGFTNVEYGGGCDGAQCQTIGPPSLSYECSAFSVNVIPGENEDGEYDGSLVAFFVGRPKLKSNTTYILKLKSNSANSNYDAVPTISYTTGWNQQELSKCDIHKLSTGRDRWGDCIQAGTCYDADDIDPGSRCNNTDKIYKIVGGGSKQYSCEQYCNTNDPPTTEAPVFVLSPVTTRPADDSGLLSQEEALAKIAEDNDGAYWVRIDNLRVDWDAKTKCTYYCKATRQQEIYFVGTGKVSEGSAPSLYDACLNCMCEVDEDCGSCEVCCGGKCIGYPSTEEEAACHPCAGFPGSKCCEQFDMIGNKGISCANPKNCEECISFPNPLFGSFARTPWDPNNPTKACCDGIPYDPRCQDCKDNFPFGKYIEEKCIAPELCIKTGTDEWEDTDGNIQTYDTMACQIPPCPPCQFEADDYEETGNCVAYNGSVKAILACMECEVISNPFYPTFSSEPYIPYFTSTLDEGEECCQTGETTAVPSKKCCSDGPGDYSYSCEEDQKCCNGTCLNEGECCGESGAEPAPACQDCAGVDKCPPGTTCCTQFLPYPNNHVLGFAGCADPKQCQECGTGWGGFNQGVRPTYDTTDPCLECNEGSVDTITSDDPEDPCYSAPQSIFYEP